MTEAAPAAIPCVIYAAKSTEDRRGSIADQLAQCREAIAQGARRGVIAEYVDEAVSGYRRDRGPGLRDALEHCEDLAAEHGLAELWAQHSDRLARGDGRRARHTVEIALWALKKDVRVRTLQDPDTFRDLLYAVVTGQRNNEDSKRKGAAAMAGVRRAVARGEFVGTVPDGYRLVRSLTREGAVKRRLEIDRERQPLIELIFRLGLRGRTPGQITATVTNRRWLTKPARRPFGPRPFEECRIRAILTDPRYAALAVREGEILARGYWPAYITERQHRRLVARVRNPERNAGPGPKETYLLRGVVSCGRCGHALTIASRKPRLDGTRRRAYRCTSSVRHRGSAQCQTRPMDAHVIEAMLGASLPTLLERPAGRSADGQLPCSPRFAEHLRVSQREQRDLADAARISDWIERENAGRSAPTRAESPQLTRIVAGWFALLQITVDEQTVTITATRRTANGVPDPATVLIDRTTWARAAPSGSCQLSSGRWARSEIIGAIHRFVDEYGRPPIRQEWSEADGSHPADWTVVRGFGSWQRAIKAAGYYARPPQHRPWGDEEILEAIRDWYSTHGSPPRPVDWLHASNRHPGEGTVRARLGGFANARRLAGVPNPIGGSRRERWTEEEIANALRTWVASHGTVPSSAEWRTASPDRPTAHTLRDHYGSWARGLEAFGFTPRDPPRFHRRWDRDLIATALASWAKENGRPPTASDTARAMTIPATHTVERHFGTWAKGLRAAGLPTPRRPKPSRRLRRGTP